MYIFIILTMYLSAQRNTWPKRTKGSEGLTDWHIYKLGQVKVNHVTLLTLNNTNPSDFIVYILILPNNMTNLLIKIIWTYKWSKKLRLNREKLIVCYNSTHIFQQLCLKSCDFLSLLFTHCLQQVKLLIRGFRMQRRWQQLLFHPSTLQHRHTCITWLVKIGSTFYSL